MLCMGKNDRALILQVLSGNKEAYGALVLSHTQCLFRVAPSVTTMPRAQGTSGTMRHLYAGSRAAVRWPWFHSIRTMSKGVLQSTERS
jgi:hypothetical protein